LRILFREFTRPPDRPFADRRTCLVKYGWFEPYYATGDLDVNPLSIFALLPLFTLSQQRPDPTEVAGKVREKLQSAASLSVETELRGGTGSPLKFTVKALRPNYYKVEGERQSFFSDGKATWQYFPLLGEFGPFRRDESGMFIPQGQGFESFSPPPQYKPVYTGAEEVMYEGRKAIALVQEPKEIPGLRLRTLIDPKTWLPVAYEQTLNGRTTTTIYRNVRTDQKLTPKDFAWSPPKGARDSRTIRREGPKPLAAGETAPSVSLKLASGRTVGLKDLAKGKKAVLVNFWFINCGYCLMELPELVALHKELKDQGLELLTVNDEDALDDVLGFLKRSGYAFPVAMDGDKSVAKAFRVESWGRPITFLLDSDGKVSHSQVGYDTTKKLTDLRAALEKMGFTRKSP
jgi:peroxiredoxin/outer membrane lipoprotein-sorting protein